MAANLGLPWYTDPDQGEDALIQGLVECWARVSNAGGAVGFPFLPATEAGVPEAMVSMVVSLSKQVRLVVATANCTLAGWLLFTMNDSALTAHWTRVTRLQTDLQFRSQGLGDGARDRRCSSCHGRSRAGTAAPHTSRWNGPRGLLRKAWLGADRPVARCSASCRGRGPGRSADAPAVTRPRRALPLGPTEGAVPLLGAGQRSAVPGRGAGDRLCGRRLRC